MFAFIKKTERFYGYDATYRAIDFFTRLMLMEEKIENLPRAFVSVAKKSSRKPLDPTMTQVFWVEDLDIDGLNSVLQSITKKEGSAWDRVSHLPQKEIQEEIRFLNIVVKEWTALKKIKKYKSDMFGRMLWSTFKKSIAGEPYELLTLKHEHRFKQDGQ